MWSFRSARSLGTRFTIGPTATRPASLALVSLWTCRTCEKMDKNGGYLVDTMIHTDPGMKCIAIISIILWLWMKIYTRHCELFTSTFY